MQLQNSTSFSSCAIQSKEFGFYSTSPSPTHLFCLSGHQKTIDFILLLSLHKSVATICSFTLWLRVRITQAAGVGGACRGGTCDWNMWPRQRGRCERVPSGLCKCLHTVSISAGGPASPYHLVVCRSQFCQRYHLASGSERRDGGKTRVRCQGFV